MYKVKYREYWNDTHYNFLEKEFSCLEEISDWLFSQMQTRVSSENMTFEYHLLPDNTGYCSINIHPDPSSEKDVTIFLIIDEKGVIYYSNGRMTDRKYVSKKYLHGWKNAGIRSSILVINMLMRSRIRAIYHKS